MEGQETFLDCFSDIDDPRIDRKKLHPVEEILLLTLCGVICGCDGWGALTAKTYHYLPTIELEENSFFDFDRLSHQEVCSLTSTGSAAFFVVFCDR